MPYIGKNPVGGGFHKLDALTASATATYALTLGSAAYYPESANQLLVSLNGVIQAPQDSFTVSGSNLVFDTALTASDSIDFVVALGDVLAVQTVTDGAITANKLGNGAVTSAKLDTNIAVSGNLDVGTIRDAAGTNTAMTIDSTGRILTPARPAFNVRSTGTQGGINGVIQFNDAILNSGNHYDTTNYYFQAPVTGLYCFMLNAFASASNGGATSGTITVNFETSSDASTWSTSRQYYAYTNASAYLPVHTSFILEMTANHYIRLNVANLYLYQPSPLNGSEPNFSGYLIG
jgi:hypothetical protein